MESPLDKYLSEVKENLALVKGCPTPTIKGFTTISEWYIQDIDKLVRIVEVLLSRIEDAELEICMIKINEIAGEK